MLKEKLSLLPPFSAFVTVVGRFAEGGEADGKDAGKEDGGRSVMASGFLISVLCAVVFFNEDDGFFVVLCMNYVRAVRVHQWKMRIDEVHS
jgi:hypothetical protein